MIELLAQLWIVVFSLAGSHMVARTDKYHRWGFVVLMIGQPGWFVTTWSASQWPLFAMAFYYTWVHFEGIRNRFGEKA